MSIKVEDMKISQLNAIPSPRFEKEQYVTFVGGRGQVKNLWTESGAWVYAVETSHSFSYGVSDYSRKTTVLLHEADLWEEPKVLSPEPGVTQMPDNGVSRTSMSSGFC